MTLLLTSTSDLVQVVTGGTQVVHVHASWLDNAAGTITPTRLNTIISSATTTTVVGSPAASAQRNVKFLSIQNTDASASVAITVQHTDGTTAVQLFKATLPAGWTASYNDLEGWFCVDAAGGRVVNPLQGRLLKTSLLTSGTSFTTGPSTNSLRLRLQAAGGQGGGCSATIGCVGGGGGSGSYAEWVVAVTPNTTYTYAIGAGGSTGGTGANGQAGGNTTFTVGATTCTANGGGGGNNGGSISVPVLGGTGGALSTNGTLNLPGSPGEGCITTGTAANNRSGAGAIAVLGAGANAVLEATNTNGSSAAALGYGGGGSGAATSAATARSGGAGAPGCIVIDEFS